MEPLKVTTEYLSSASYPTLADVRFYFNEIQMNLDFYIGQNNFTQSEIAASIFQKIDEYSSLMDATSVISTILDPRTKLNAFHNNEIQDAKQQVLRLMDHYQNESFESFTAILAKPSTNNSKKTREYFRGLRNQAYAQPSFLQNKSPTQKNHTELEIYLAEPVDEENDDPVLYWKTSCHKFPILSRMARDFLSIQATSVASERMFSMAGHTISKTRNRIHPETARASLCVKSWILNGIGDQ